MDERYLIVGLGNPGRQYKHSRHNVGFQIADALTERHGLKFTRRQHNAFVADGRIERRLAVLAKPQGFMNRSGIPVAGLVRFYRIALDHLLVIYDDLDLPVGTIRLKPSGGAGGHRGMNSTIERLGSSDFPRLRVGIGRPPGQMDPAAYVLKNFDKDQQAIMAEVHDRAVAAIETWLTDGLELAMTRHNGAVELA
jgi:PTH1 family peptidyl-tRNA hydrolase